MKQHRYLVIGALLLGGAFPVRLHAEMIVSTGQVVARVGSTVLTEEQMRKDLGMSLYEAENNIFQLKKNWIDQQAKTLLYQQAAKEAGLPLAKWQTREIESKVQAPTQQEIQQIISRYPPAQQSSTETLRQVTQMLTNQKRFMQENQVYQQLAAKTPVEVVLAKPVMPQIDVTYGPDDPSRGPKKAPVTVIEFTDFQCPYCKQAVDTLSKVEEAYKGKLKIVSRQFPLNFHPRAKPAAEAALCAKEQGKFWEFRDKLFSNQSQLEDADFRRYAKETGLNAKKFETCYTSHKYAAKVDADLAAGQKYGVRGTPHFFINGKPLNGAQPFESFKTAIDEELAKK